MSRDSIIQEIETAAQTAFIDSSINSNLAYRPQFLSNDYRNGKKVLSSLETELASCDQFIISVAFVTESGIVPLLQTLQELEDRNVPGKILTTDYLTFSDPKALRKLSSYHNIELRMHVVDNETKGFHTKGYIFYNHGIVKTIIGSSNLTQSALTMNREWNTKYVSTEQGEMIQDVLCEFNELWEQSKPIEELIETYSRMYEEHKSVLKQTKVPSITQYKLQPNAMQIGFINNLKKLRESGAKKALLISATGTGKTYASAFALRDENPRKALFLVHREQIAKQAIKSYKNVFGDTKSFGLLSGTSKDKNVDYLFATMQTMSKADVMAQFSKNEFSTIIIDEVHRAGAESYRKIMNYFTPNFWLGMTASPDRPDGFDIYALFDHNIAYEIRLQQALEENLLCPFHYFGITDLQIDGQTFDEKSGLDNFNLLTSNQRVDYIIDKAKYFGFSGNRVKGLIFCSRKDEARELSRQFNIRGFKTTCLSGEDTQNLREEVIERLVSDDRDDKLDYIFSVDIFNEGIDIPEINQVIMLRPTESPIVFIQQLGRGLRKTEDKEYVMILDFIGNYANNFMIPIALSGDRSYNKDTIRRYLMEGTRVIPGCSSIHFDEISKKRIYASIDNVSTTRKLLSDKYLSLKNKLGKIPTVLDFYEYSEIDPMLFINYAGSYHRFLELISEKDYTVSFNQNEERTLEFISSLLANGKRPHELLLLKMLINDDSMTEEQLESALLKEFHIEDSAKSITSAYHFLEKDFLNTQSEKAKYENIDIMARNQGYYKRTLKFYSLVKNQEFYRQLSDVIQLGLKRYKDIYMKNVDDSGLCLYQKYSRKDVCRILNWEKDDSSTIYGYRIKYNTCPIFVTYEKKEDISDSTKYEDRFVNNKIFSWMTRNNVTLESNEPQELIHYKESGLKICIFIKKSDGEGTDFYYIGQAFPKEWTETTIRNNKGKELPIMNFKFELQHSVRDDIYEYFTK